MAHQIFEDLRIVEIGDGMAASLTGMVFADNGAEVIKVEPPGGAPSRENPAFPMWGRGKKSVVLDLGTRDGAESVRRLVADADVVIATFAPGEAERLGLDHGACEAVNTRLITVSISGFGVIERVEHLGLDEAAPWRGPGDNAWAYRDGPRA